MDTAPSPAPGVPQTKTKAYVATGLTVVTTFIMLWVADTDPFTVKEAASAGVQALLAGGIVGVPTSLVRNRAL